MGNSTVLIADDDETLVRVLTVRCRNLGLKVMTASNAESAQDHILKHRPDLMILDVNMPGGGAFAVCEMVAAKKELEGIPVIILTGQTDREVMDEARRYGAFYVPKSPYLWTTVKPMIGRWLNIPQAAL